MVQANQAPLFENRHAFVVGIDAYDHAPSLQTPINDTRELASVLQNPYNYTIYECLNPNGETLRGYVDNMATIVGEKDCVIFYFAGHGITDDSDKGIKGFIVPADGDVDKEDTLISMHFLLEAFSKLNCKHFLLILDCCFAGAFRWAEKYRAAGRMNDQLFQQHYRYYTNNPSWQVLTSASHKQKASDYMGNRLTNANKHSPFAQCLIDGLKGEADTNKDKIITLAELYNYLQNRFGGMSMGIKNVQNVGLFPLEQHGNGEFMFIPNGFDPAELTEKDYENPYMGLQAYDEEKEHLFFGRNSAIKDLLEKVKSNCLTVVIGASGSGKSSLVKAGILPKLIRHGRNVKEMRPSKDPVAELANLGDGFDVLVIDQFEEIITQSDATKAAEFMHILRGYVEARKMTIIITVRLDFETQIDKKEIDNAWQEGRFKIQPFTFDELREVIITPSARVGRFIDDNKLVNEIANEVIQYQGSLPLLSFTLSELFEKCRGDLYRNIRYEDYEELGGVTGSLQQTANRIVASLTDKEQQTLRNIMLRMVSFSTGTIASKRVMLKDLEFSDSTENQRVETIKNKLIEARLIVPDKDSNNQEFIEPTHDALIQAWSKLSEWIKTRSEESLLLQNKLTDAVNDFDIDKNKKRLWHNDARLDLMKEQLLSDQKWLNKREVNFLQQSVDLAKRNRNRTILIVAGIILILLVLTLWAFSQQKEATVQRDNAQVQQKIAEDNLKKYLFEQKDKNNQRLPILLQQSETFEVAEEYAKEKEWLDSIQNIIQQFQIEKDSLKVSFDSLKTKQERNLKNLKRFER